MAILAPTGVTVLDSDLKIIAAMLDQEDDKIMGQFRLDGTSGGTSLKSDPAGLWPYPVRSQKSLRMVRDCTTPVESFFQSLTILMKKNVI